jgi:protein TonB
MSNAAAKSQTGSGAAKGTTPGAPKRAKLAAFLVTGDEGLWPQIGAHLPAKLNFRQVDSIAELLSGAAAESPAVVVWDARASTDKSAELSRIQSHSASFAMLVLDEDDSAWSSAVQHGQIVSFIGVPVDQSRIVGALGAAYEEVNARIALLGEQSSASSGAGGRRSPKALILGAVVLAAAGAAGFYWYRSGGDPGSASAPAAAGSPATSPAAVDGSAPAGASSPGSPAGSQLPTGASSAEDKADALIEQAQLAMRDRHFIDPMEGSALALYRGALLLDPSNGEARQGLQRLAEVLLARVQSALDEHQFDAALQALETVRSIDPGDKRLPAFDDRIAKMRAELGPAEILAAINAQNFERAAQLIDQAAHAKSIPEPKLAQLRQELARRRSDSNTARLAALVDARLQQDQLADPPSDSAVYYFNQARKTAGANDLQSQQRELSRRLTAAARADIGQQQFDEADRMAMELRSIGAPLSQIAGLQHDIGVARAQRAQLAAPEPSRPSADGSQSAPGGSAGQTASTPAGSADSAVHIAPSGAASGPREVAEASLTRTRTLDIDYPQDALHKQTEGKVEVGYVVTPKGVVSDLQVLSSTPPGIFDRAATSAVSRLRYKPVLDAGKPVAVSTKMLVTFRIAK